MDEDIVIPTTFIPTVVALTLISPLALTSVRRVETTEEVRHA